MVLRNLVLAIMLIVQFSGCGGNSQIRTAESEKGTLGIVQSSEIPRGMTLKKYREEKRLALVIGNKDYSDLTSLKNPINDSRAMQTALEKLNFEVFYLENGTKRAMRNKIDDFTTLLKQSKGIGMIFYAGHGLEVGGTNYLIPTDAIIEKKLDVKNESVSLDDILYQLEESKNRLNIVVLDACRNDPFKNRSLSRIVLGESKKGLATPPSAKGLYIAYSADVGQEAQDGSGKNGTFTKHLLENIQKEGVNLNKVFQITRKDVEIETDGKQSPASYDKTTGDFYFIVPKELPKQKISITDQKRTEFLLNIETFPKNTKIKFADGKDFQIGKLLKKGSYKIEVSKSGYLTKTLNIELDRDSDISVKLKKVIFENENIPNIEKLKIDLDKTLIWSGKNFKDFEVTGNFKERFQKFQNRELKKSNLFLETAKYNRKTSPKGKFETTEEFQERKDDFENMKRDFQQKYTQKRNLKLMDIAKNRSDILNSWLGKQYISMKYDADTQKFSVTVNWLNFKISVPRKDAKKFKERVKNFDIYFEEKQKLFSDKTYLFISGAKTELDGKEYISNFSLEIDEKTFVQIEAKRKEQIKLNQIEAERIERERLAKIEARALDINRKNIKIVKNILGTLPESFRILLKNIQNIKSANIEYGKNREIKKINYEDKSGVIKVALEFDKNRIVKGKVTITSMFLRDIEIRDIGYKQDLITNYSISLKDRNGNFQGIIKFQIDRKGNYNSDEKLKIVKINVRNVDYGKKISAIQIVAGVIATQKIDLTQKFNFKMVEGLSEKEISIFKDNISLYHFGEFAKDVFIGKNGEIVRLDNSVTSVDDSQSIYQESGQISSGMHINRIGFLKDSVSTHLQNSFVKVANTFINSVNKNFTEDTMPANMKEMYEAMKFLRDNHSNLYGNSGSINIDLSSDKTFIFNSNGAFYIADVDRGTKIAKSPEQEKVFGFKGDIQQGRLDGFGMSSKFMSGDVKILKTTSFIVNKNNELEIVNVNLSPNTAITDDDTRKISIAQRGGTPLTDDRLKLLATKNFNAMLKSEIWAKLSVSEKNRMTKEFFKNILVIELDKNSKAYNLIANYGVFENIETINNPTDFVKNINILFKKNGSNFLNQ